MAGLAVQNFLSAATGIAVAIALIRGFVRRTAATIGNFWVDVTRTTLYVLLPLAAAPRGGARRSRRDPESRPYREAATIEKLTFENPKTDTEGKPLKDARAIPVTETVTTQTQTLPMGPVASQEAIKELGTNGGGFYNANSAHPFENPTALSNFMEMLAILLIPLALTYTFGVMVGDRRQGYALMAAMLILLVPLATVGLRQRTARQPADASASVDAGAGTTQSGGNMEGKETRFGIAASALFAAVDHRHLDRRGQQRARLHDAPGRVRALVSDAAGRTDARRRGNRSVHMLIFAILGVFIAGLMIGRTPEYLGKKIQALRDETRVHLHSDHPTVVLIGTAVAVMTEAGQGRGRQSGAARIQRDPLRVHLGGQQQRQRLRRHFREHAVLQRRARPRHVGRPLLADRGRRSPSPARWRQRSACRSPKARCRRTGRCSWCCSSASILLIGVLTYVPALALGPRRRAFHARRSAT